MLPFEDSFFVVTFTGEGAESRLIKTWDRVLAFIDYEVGAAGDGWSVRNEDCSLHDRDNWTHLNYSEDGDTRHLFHESEFVYCTGLHVVRLTCEVNEEWIGAAKGGA